MKPAELTVEHLEKFVGMPAEQWHGLCFEIATAAAKLLGNGSVAVYGHYLGEMDPEGYWGPRSELPFVHHGWVRLADGRVLDPTRWSFENVEPYIFRSADAHHPEYDEGGNEWRHAMMRPAPTRQPGAKTARLQADAETLSMLTSWLGRTEVKVGDGWADLTIDQIFWLANAPYDLFGSYVFQVYEAICLAYSPEAIPIDNRRQAERDAGRLLPRLSKRSKPTKPEGRTQLVGYAMQHGLVERITEARKMRLDALRTLVEKHRASSTA